MKYGLITEQQFIGILIITYFVIWVGIFKWVMNNDMKVKARKIMDNTIDIYKMVILGVEHLAILIVGFLGGALTFYFKSKYYLNSRVFTKEEVRGLINMALGEERRKESSLMRNMIRKLK
tara:strand:- start:138 stop:497 length:360 start_codon:yes stop_codon:yes gene_type:complete